MLLGGSAGNTRIERQKAGRRKLQSEEAATGAIEPLVHVGRSDLVGRTIRNAVNRSTRSLILADQFHGGIRVHDGNRVGMSDQEHQVSGLPEAAHHSAATAAGVEQDDVGMRP